MVSNVQSDLKWMAWANHRRRLQLAVYRDELDGPRQCDLLCADVDLICCLAGAKNRQALPHDLPHSLRCHSFGVYLPFPDVRTMANNQLRQLLSYQSERSLTSATTKSHPTT